MNIVFVSTFDQRCGIATYTRKLGEAMVAQGHGVFVYGERQVVAHESDEVKQLGSIRYLRRWSRGAAYPASFGLGEVARSILAAPKKPDVVHIQHEFAFFPHPKDLGNFTNMLHEGGIPCVMTLHTVSPEQRLALMPLALTADCIVHTPEAFALVESECGGLTSVIPHGITSLPSADERRHLLVPGYISPNKNVLEIIEGYWRAQVAMDRARGGYLPQLIIAGLCRDAEYEHKISAAIRRYALEDWVSFRPNYVPDDDAARYLQSAVAVILGAGDTTPYSASGQMHDAIGAGTPIIAKNTPIYRHPAGAGVLHYRDAEELAQWLLAVTRLTAQARLRERNQRVAQAQSWEVVAKMTLARYAEGSRG